MGSYVYAISSYNTNQLGHVDLPYLMPWAIAVVHMKDVVEAGNWHNWISH